MDALFIDTTPLEERQVFNTGRIREAKILIRIYVVDDHPFVREGLKTFLGTQEGIRVVGEADSA